METNESNGPSADIRRFSSEIPLREIISAAYGPRSQTRFQKLRAFCKQILTHWGYAFCMILLTLFVLFCDDIRLIATSKSTDDIFFSFVTICMVFFTFDIIISSIIIDRYFLSFFFWLDIVLTASLIMDIGWIWDQITGDNKITTGEGTQASKVQTASQASRTGTRAARIIRALKTVRLIRIAKLYKIAQSQTEKKQSSQQKLERSPVLYRGTDNPINVNYNQVQEIPLGDINSGSSLSAGEDSYSQISNENRLDRGICAFRGPNVPVINDVLASSAGEVNLEISSSRPNSTNSFSSVSVSRNYFPAPQRQDAPTLDRAIIQFRGAHDPTVPNSVNNCWDRIDSIGASNENSESQSFLTLKNSNIEILNENKLDRAVNVFRGNQDPISDNIINQNAQAMDTIRTESNVSESQTFLTSRSVSREFSDENKLGRASIIFRGEFNPISDQIAIENAEGIDTIRSCSSISESQTFLTPKSSDIDFFRENKLERGIIAFRGDIEPVSNQVIMQNPVRMETLKSNNFSECQSFCMSDISSGEKANKTFDRAVVVYRGNTKPISDQFIYQNINRINTIKSNTDFSLSQSFSDTNSQNIIKSSQISEENRRNHGGSADGSIQSDFLTQMKRREEELKIGEDITDIATKRVIILVFSVLIIIPFFSTAFIQAENTSYQYGLSVINVLLKDNETEAEFAFEQYVDDHKNKWNPLIYLMVNHTNMIYRCDIDPNELRPLEQLTAVLPDVDNDYYYFSYAVFDMRPSTRLDAGLNMIETAFICVLLLAASTLIAKDTKMMLHGPFGKMIEDLKAVLRNPLKAGLKAQKEELKQPRQILRNDSWRSILGKETTIYETKYLQSTINKIAILLASGFGESGMKIIEQNLSNVDGNIETLVPGKKTYCIFGICKIRNFNETTEILREDVLGFVNQIAHIVQSVTEYFSGHINKNMGNSFLMVWKPYESNSIEENEILSDEKFSSVSEIADMSFICCLKIIAGIYKHPYILKYRDHIELTQHMPGYSVQLGFGLHYGWAIEGVIGSEYKIDASYLSPALEVSKKLESLTKHYGVPLIISNSLYENCSEQAKSKMRKIDEIQLSLEGNVIPLELYTCDIAPELLKPYEKINSENMNKLSKRIKERKENLKKKIAAGEYKVAQLLEHDRDLFIMTNSVSDKFIRTYEKALNYYKEGNWAKAREGFIKAQNLKKVDDGPCRALLDYMKDIGASPPESWKGYREINESNLWYKSIKNKR
ncbi:unnamed protein product [Blepharisma stoltei]|uniref:Guanylate cyclase domain-containing protein n=1 Tax=Blepharisma stoltei TaxID=1481888 RepID=A0AAU9JKP8_9CILI|nr:unnamed protein product [Blepharisma stoltei]